MSSSKSEHSISHGHSSELLENILPIVREAGRLALSLQGELLKIDTKDDGSPVTHADRAVEAFLYETLESIYPEDGFQGEEESYRASKSGRNWVVDPIDGTIQFIRGQEFWSILVALDSSQGGHLGVISFPARDELIYAEKGSGCWEIDDKGSSKRLKVSDIDELSEAYVLHNGIEFARRAGHDRELCNALAIAKAERGYADAFGHIEVARGHSDVMIDFLTEYHDIAAVRVAVEEAGGRWSALDGTQLLGSQSNGSITTNGLLHEAMLLQFNASND